ncbi:MAG: CapA family protein [Burkholderiales bacterium]|nr:CapA family protein [Burkholderiales bacterium]
MTVTESERAHRVVFLGAGDCGPVHGPRDGFPIERYGALIRPTLQAADLRIANCERQYSARGAAAARTPHGCQPPAMADIFTDCGFDALSLANNHMFDAGEDALLDTRALLIEKGIAVAGAGRDLEQARAPAILERNGLRIGLLSYCSVLPEGAAAGPGKPGVAPLRVLARYEPRGPHAPVRVLTHPDERDLAMVIEDIGALRRRVDVVLVAFHWGVIWVPRVVADYQVIAAHAAIDAGADMILGHHAHIPKAIEVYRGKVVFYSLSNFCMTKPAPNAVWNEQPWQQGVLRNHADLDPDYPLLPYGRDAKRSLLAKALFTKAGVAEVAFLPMVIDRAYRPRPVRAGEAEFDDILAYMSWCSEGFPHRFSVRGDEVRIDA